MLFLLLINPALAFAQRDANEMGRVVSKTVQHGNYFQYIPRNASKNSKVAVIVHGVFTPPDSPAKAAETYLNQWIQLADQLRIVLVAPVFDDANFCSARTSTSNWGYRGLLGRQIGADEFVHEVIAKLEAVNPQYDGRFILFGHSAGGQFANRYLVTHPQRVIAAVISAPSWYAFPNDSVLWPNGMKRRQRTEKWQDGTTRDIDVQPREENFLAATQVPTLVVVGDRDLKPLERGRYQDGGQNRVERARLWVASMNSFATKHQAESKITFLTMPGIEHSPRESLAFAAKHLQSLLLRSKLNVERQNQRTKR